tara:strand:- start:5183 stop:6889 length:1707 start_codon:yes stop_codon:yes gene_type:complete
MALFKIDYNSKSFTKLTVIKLSKNSIYESNEENSIFFSNKPIFYSNNSFETVSLKPNFELKSFHNTIQNNVSGFSFSKKNIFLSSSRFTRSKWHYIEKDSALFFADNLWELIPYSKRTLDRVSSLSIIKFGETSELSNIISDINCIPVSCSQTISVKNNKLCFDDPRQYFQLNYNFNGGDITKTQNILDSICKYLSKEDIVMPISGGIDSTLLNYRINSFRESSYPAYFVQFGNNDPETEFAKKAVLNSKAELQIINMESDDFIQAFDYQTSHLKSPIGEASAIPLAHFFKQNNFENKTIIDGTLADGCYGSMNYNKNLFEGISKQSSFKQILNEKIAAYLQLKNKNGQFKFFPRDAYIKDDFLKFMNVYAGPLTNYVFKNAKKINSELEKQWLWYYNLINWDTNKLNSSDVEWLKYTIFKMIGYASRVTTAKVEDLSMSNNVEYPFIWLEVLRDQCKYSWNEKTNRNTIKFPLKKILEQHKSNDFIYRKKVGLNNAVPFWINEKKNSDYLISILVRDKVLVEELIGKKNLNLIIKRFKQSPAHQNINNLILSLSSLSDWCFKNKISI